MEKRVDVVLDTNQVAISPITATEQINKDTETDLSQGDSMSLNPESLESMSWVVGDDNTFD